MHEQNGQCNLYAKIHLKRIFWCLCVPFQIYLQLICFANYMHQTSEWVIRPLSPFLVHEIIASIRQIERCNLLHCFATVMAASATAASTSTAAIAATVECSFTYNILIKSTWRLAGCRRKSSIQTFLFTFMNWIRLRNRVKQSLNNVQPRL